MMDRDTVEGVVMELETMLDTAVPAGVASDPAAEVVPAGDVQRLRDRLKFVLDNSPTD